MNKRQLRSLFCVMDANHVCGANRVLFEWIARLNQLGQTAELFSWRSQQKPAWFEKEIPLSRWSSLDEAVSADYDMVFFSVGFLIALAVPAVRSARTVYVCQGYESYLYGNNFAEVNADKPELDRLLELPSEIIATSRSVARLVSERSGRPVTCVPVGLDLDLFKPGAAAPGDPASKYRRILMVGNPAVPVKGFDDGLQALKQLAEHEPIELVLISGEMPPDSKVAALPFKVELHCQPERGSIPAIYASCHLYLCTSWYEGLGMPALEAMACGLPVVSTKHSGTTDFAVNGNNLLLAAVHDPADIYSKLQTLLHDASMRERFISNGYRTAQSFTWDNSIDALLKWQKQVIETDSGKQRCQPEAARQLLQELERRGRYTPLAVKELIKRHENDVREQCLRYMARKLTIQELVAAVAATADAIEELLRSPESGYYDRLKSLQTLCRLIALLWQEPGFDAHLARMLESNRLLHATRE